MSAHSELFNLGGRTNLPRLPNFTQLVTLSTLIVLTLLPHTAQGSGERLTKYGCEGTTLQIECAEGTAINLVRANYGRFSISICNAAGVTDWSVNCMEPRTLRVINARCQGKPSCRIPVDSKIFGDPCPGTNKYVEVHYTCQAVRKAQPTTVKALPPWLLDLAATPSSVVVTQPTTTTTTTATTTTTTESSTITTTQTTEPTTTTASNEIPQDQPDIIVEKHVIAVDESENDIYSYDDEDEEGAYEDEASLDNGPKFEDNVQRCPPLSSRGLFWNWTRAGEVAIKVCPQGSSGFARWACGSDGRWTSDFPNLSECQSNWLARMEASLQGNTAGRSLNGLGLELAALTETKTLYGGDFAVAAKIMQALAHRLGQELYVMASQEDKETLVAEQMQSVMKATSNLLDGQHALAWSDLDNKKRSVAGTALMLAIEENGILLTETINTEKQLIEATNNVVSSMRIMKARGVTDQTFPQTESLLVSETSEITIPSQTLLAKSVNGASRLVFFLYNNLESILPRPDAADKFVNSKVMGAVYSKSRNMDVYGRPVTVTLRHLDTVGVSSGGGRNPTCAVWDYSDKVWNTDQCTVRESNLTHTTCHCLTVGNYAVLMDAAPSSGLPHTSGGNDGSFTTMVVCVAVLTVCLLVALVGLAVKRLSGNRLSGLLKSSKLPCTFHCKKSESQNSCSSTGGLYPALTSSPTSTTVSGASAGTPNSSNYLVQILEQQQQTLKHIKGDGNPAVLQNGTIYMPQKAVPQQKGSSIYQVTAPRPTIVSQLTDGQGSGTMFRPVSPPNGQTYNQTHHIYMEIDPVYAQAADQAQQMGHLTTHHQLPAVQHVQQLSEVYQSDIQLSDISDDDLRRFSDTSSRATHYGEERPLIRASVGNNNSMNNNNNNLMRQSLMAAAAAQQRQQHAATLGMRQPLQVATLSTNNQSLRGLNGARTLRTPITYGVHHSANPSLVSNPDHQQAPIAIALQGNDQFVSLQIDGQQ